MNRILVPVDFSKASYNALVYAVELFGATNLEITILHLYGTKSSAFVMKNIDHVLEESARQNMNEFLNGIQNKFPDVSFRIHLSKSSAIATIAEFGDSGQYDYIVMGTKGATGLKEVFMGSVAGGVVSKSTAPVIVVPSSHEFDALKQIILAAGDEPLPNPEVLTPLRKVVKAHNSKVKVLHISNERIPHTAVDLSTISDLNPTAEYGFGSGDVNKDVNEYLATTSAGLVCLIRTKKGFWDRIFSESVTLKSTFHSPVPLLVLHDV